jgi:glutamine phosphoribosylpyrophosphate amidotransferase
MNTEFENHMCGICGIVLKDTNNNPNFSIGALIYQMMESQQVRAQDSAGIAIFNNGKEYCRDDDNLSFNLNYFKRSAANTNASITSNITNGYELIEEKISIGKQVNDQQSSSFSLLSSQLSKDYDENNDTISIIGYSKKMKIVKDMGLVKDLDKKYNIKSIRGTHGIGHLRIATSSRVDPSNAHPFSTTVIPDIAVVHNGEITNYSKLKSLLEIKGYPFYSSCDSEVIAVFLADQLLMHGDIQRAHTEFIRKADGPFTYIAATSNSLSLVRDKFGTRKGIIGYNRGSSGSCGSGDNRMEQEERPPFWAMATDLSALDIVGANEYVQVAPPGKPIIFAI